MLTAIIVILSVVVYANIGFVVGLHIHKTVATLEDSPASLMGAIFWPVLLGYLKNQRKKELAARETLPARTFSAVEEILTHLESVRAEAAILEQRMNTIYHSLAGPGAVDAQQDFETRIVPSSPPPPL